MSTDAWNAFARGMLFARLHNHPIAYRLLNGTKLTSADMQDNKVSYAVREIRQEMGAFFPAESLIDTESVYAVSKKLKVVSLIGFRFSGSQLLKHRQGAWVPIKAKMYRSVEEATAALPKVKMDLRAAQEKKLKSAHKRIQKWDELEKQMLELKRETSRVKMEMSRVVSAQQSYQKRKEKLNTGMV